MRKPAIWFANRCDINLAVQAQKMARGWKFWIEKEEKLNRENKGTDQLRSYCEADLRLCFRICEMLFFSCRGTNLFACEKKKTFNHYRKSLQKILFLPTSNHDC